MAAMPDLQFRRLAGEEVDLLNALAAAAPAAGFPSSENFGVGGDTPPAAAETWGLFVRNGLVGGAWFEPVAEGLADIRGLVLGRTWWRTGLNVWMIQELARSAELAGCRGTVVRIDEAGPEVGEALADAGFAGPDREEETYPVGEWRRMAPGFHDAAQADVEAMMEQGEDGIPYQGIGSSDSTPGV